MSGSPTPVGRLRRSMVCAVFAGVLVAACGGAGETVTHTVTHTVTDQTTVTRDGGSHGSTGGDDSSSPAKTPKDDGLAWVPYGPKDPAFPTPGWDVYVYFVKHDCESLKNVQKPEGKLYDAALAACRAAVNGEQSQWDVAATAFAARGAGTEIGPVQCVDDTIAAMVTKLLAWHDEHPGSQPELSFPQTGGRTACSRDNNSFVPPDETDSTTTSSTTSSTVTTTSSTTTTTTTTSPTTR
ncbi:hypothetical protein FZI91_12205 [Mycobacterium sp. CBMA271]|uniref:hypothetical protein n=1 Tax=unclassified Mycobacteroides TaxID=2618759 RepID=UPI0012DDB646|nr:MULTISPECIES: hypothetical protein [unclassified Mycobacteroides]MUM16044.1 hypothetical protein [Mycobacteroides sp. CBMA 326]MUM22457.1 hypothetical protein [Mycobacteroides sp. CBMA 271]